jgi:hypothetical protein
VSRDVYVLGEGVTSNLALSEPLNVFIFIYLFII